MTFRGETRTPCLLASGEMGTLHIQRLDSEPGYPQITGAANVVSKADGGGSLLARAVHASTGGARGLVH